MCIRDRYNSNRRSVKRKKRERQRPGVSPLVYSRFLLENGVFLSLLDMGKAVSYTYLDVYKRQVQNKNILISATCSVLRLITLR